MPSRGALWLAVTLYRDPSLRHLMRTAPVPEDIGTLLALAGGDRQRLEATAIATGENPSELLEAARFFIEETLLQPDADDHRTLGLQPGADLEQARTHYRALQSWLHPDRQAGMPLRAANAARVNAAWSRLRLGERIADGQHDSPAPPTGRVQQRWVRTEIAASPRRWTWPVLLLPGAIGLGWLWLAISPHPVPTLPGPVQGPGPGPVPEALVATPAAVPARDRRVSEPVVTLPVSVQETVEPVVPGEVAPDTVVAGTEPAPALVPATAMQADPPAGTAPATLATLAAAPAADTGMAVEPAPVPSASTSAATSDPGTASASSAPGSQARDAAAFERVEQLLTYLVQPQPVPPPIWHSGHALDAADAVRRELGGTSRRAQPRILGNQALWDIDMDRVDLRLPVEPAGRRSTDPRWLHAVLRWHDDAWWVESVALAPAP